MYSAAETLAESSLNKLSNRISKENFKLSKRINQGGGYGLEVPCKYHISGQEKAVNWIKRKATTFQQEHSLAVNKCLGKKYK